MDDLSVSKGVFAHCQRHFGSSAAKSTKKRKSNAADKVCLRHKEKPWYKAYLEISLAIDKAAADVHNNTFRQLLFDLRDFVVKIKSMPLLSDEIPTGILLAGVNLPDHELLLQKLEKELETVTPYIATVWSRDAATLKNLIEEVVYQIINTMTNEEKIKRIHCTFCALNAWHKETITGDTPLVIIIPDFESFCPTILHDFILILSSYMKTIKFILIFGVATTLHVVHRSLSYDATSKLNCKVFQMQQQTKRLCDVLNGIILSPDIPFKIINRAFSLLVDMFLWYDFSVDGFLKNYKLCLWRHFYNKNEKVICCKQKDISEKVSNLESEDFQKLKKVKSIKDYFSFELKKDIKNITDAKFKEKIMDLLEDFHEYMDNFLLVLNILFKISGSINYPFGKTFRQIYVSAVVKNDFCKTTEYKNAILQIGHLSREELLKNVISHTLDNEAPEDVKNGLRRHYDILKNANTSKIIEEPQIQQKKIVNRHQFKEEMKKNLKVNKQSDYEKAVVDFKKYLDEEVFQHYLRHPTEVPMHEIFCFQDVDTVNCNIKGSMKASIHTGLNNPHNLLEIPCCTENSSDISKHPDINIAYTLHLENRKMINMYDWLQAFTTIVDPNRAEDEEIDPVLQARFTQAVAELQFLGFIKATRRKADHVKKLTV